MKTNTKGRSGYSDSDLQGLAVGRAAQRRIREGASV